MCHQHYCRVTTFFGENNQNIIFVNNPDKKQDAMEHVYLTSNPCGCTRTQLLTDLSQCGYKYVVRFYILSAEM